MVYLHNGILLSRKKEGAYTLCNSMDEIDEFFNHFSLMFEYTCLHFPTFTSPPPYLPPTLKPTPLLLCPWALYTCSLMTLSLLSPHLYLPASLWLLSVLNFNVSVIFFLLICFVDQVSRIGEIIWYLSFTA